MADEKHGPLDPHVLERDAAAKARRWFGIDNDERVDVIACLTSGHVWTIGGPKRLVLEIESDREMCGTDALTSWDKERATIRVASSVYVDALARRPRATMTLAHELGHVVLCHSQHPLARVTGANRSTPRSIRVGRFEASANMFASLFLLRPDFVERYKTAREISERFGVSIAAAEICLERINKRLCKSRVVEGFYALKQDIGAVRIANHNNSGNAILGSSNGSRSISEGDRQLGVRCICTRGWLVPSGGGKYRCDDCGYVGDLPDGDSYGT